jgi:hypothetical protein
VEGSADKHRFTFRIASFANEESRARAREHLAAIFPGRAPEEIGQALERTPLRFAVTATPERAARLAEGLAELGAAVSTEPDPRAMIAPPEEPLAIPLEALPDEGTAPETVGPAINPREAMRTRPAHRAAVPAAVPPAEAAEEGPPAFFWYAWVDTLFSPQQLFASLRAPGGTLRALLFAATLGLLAAVLAFPARTLQAMESGALDVASLTDRYLFMIFTQPLFTVLGTITTAALVHLGLRLFSGPRPFEVTLKVLAYATAATVFAAIPKGGVAIAGLIGFVLSVAGLTIAQRVRTTQAIGAAFFPALLAGAILFLMVGALLFGGFTILHGLSS